jgi:hypothetical protein
MRAAARAAARALGAAALIAALPLASASSAAPTTAAVPRPRPAPAVGGNGGAAAAALASASAAAASGGDDGLLLVGSGTRIKFGFVRVYDASLFVDSLRLANFPSGAAALRAVQDGALSARISIRLLRGVAASALAEAIEAAVAPHVRARGARDARDAAADLAKLAELGPRLAAALGAELPEGTEVGFAWEGAGDLLVAVNGRPLVRFAEAPLLCGGFFATYVDEKAPLIPAARATWIAGIEAIQAASSKR